ncbi:MAG TPA: AAA family ATPase [Tepidiformaceae bacterium]|nr:AAA family ATPase [Tepidiformaceae bacterium]
MTQVAPPGPDSELLERGDAFARLEQLLAAARAGCGSLVFVSGDAGVGKTALVREFCARHQRAARVLRGACDGLRTPRPLGPFVDIASAAGGPIAEVTANKPHQVVEALLDELRRATSPALVVLEDLHWADEATLDALGLLGRRVAELAVVIIATYRSDELPRAHPLRIVVGDLATVDAVHRLQLGPLSVAAVAQLAAPYDVDACELHAKTGGNPFFVTEALAAGSDTIPSTVRDAVLARAARLGPAARDLLDAAAIVPQATEVWLLEALAPDQVSALDECLTSGILRAESQAIAFRHELARLVIEGSINPHRRTLLHRAALAALRAPRRGLADLARLAHHAEAAGDEAAVLEFAPAAGEQATAMGAHREAAAQFARALRFAGSLPPMERAALLERRSYECYLVDDRPDALATLEEAIELYRSVGNQLKEGLALASLAFRRWCASDTSGAEQAAAESVALLDLLPPGIELARAYAAASSIAMNLAKGDLAITLGERALALSEEFEDRQTLVSQLNQSGTAALLLGRLDEGLPLLERSIAIAKDSGLEADVGRGYIHLAWAGSHTRNWDLIARLQDGIQYSTERGLELWRLYITVYRARAELDQGRWQDAAESAAYVLAQPTRAPLLRTIALTVLATVRARRGDPDALPLLAEARALSADKQDLQHLAPVALAAAELAWLSGDHERVATETDRVLEIANERGVGWISGEAAFWRRRAGIQEPCPPAATEPFALHLSGDFASARERWLALGCPYEAALALVDMDEPDSLRQAFDELRRLGARPMADMVARRLRQLGEVGIARGPRASTRGNPANLTTREVDVLTLLAAGLRNAEIAERLVLSPRTVDHHVSAILQKLDVQTRGQASVEALRLGLRPSL